MNLPPKNQQSINVLCRFKASAEVVGYVKPSIEAEFLIVTVGGRSLLSRSTASDLRLLEFPRMPGVIVKFSVDKSILLTKNAYYNCICRLLQEMETKGIIERVVKATDWISGLSAVAKGKGAPNRAFKPEYFRLPLLD